MTCWPRTMPGTGNRSNRPVVDHGQRPPGRPVAERSATGARALFHPKQVEYLVDDVRYLFVLQDELIAKLQARGRLEWAIEECRTLGDPRAIAWTTAGSICESPEMPGSTVASWRSCASWQSSATVRHTSATFPLKYVIPDDCHDRRRADPAKECRRSRALRRIDNGIRRTFGTLIVGAVARGEAVPEDELPPRPTRSLTPTGASRWSRR